MSEQSNSKQAPAGEARVPSRTVGFVVMTLATVFVAFHLQQQANNPADNMESVSVLPREQLPGFRESFWFLPDEDNLGFVEIPAGPFVMGSNPGLDRMAYANERWSDLRRQGEVDLPAYWISRYETTVAQFAVYIEDTGVAATEVDLEVAGNLPVTNITWTEALAYTRWLDQKLRSSPDTPEPLRSLLAEGGRVTLPNEAEWEKAARGTDGRVFPWRNAQAASIANFNNDSLRAVNASDCEVCMWGLNDMAGNVWEMTRSILQSYPYTTEDDADNLVEDPLFVMRGGSYSDGLANIRTAVRGGIDPGTRSPLIGFRVVISTQ